MRKSLPSRPWVLPQPVLIIASYDENGKADAMNAAWGGQYEADLIELCLSEGHQTTQNILKNKDFTVSFAAKDELEACDFVGLVSGKKDPDKIKKTGWTLSEAEAVHAPVIDNLPLSLECTLDSRTENGNIIGRIVSVSCDEKYLNDKGQPDVHKMKLLSFNPIESEYLIVDEKAGKAFHDGLKLKTEQK